MSFFNMDGPVMRFLSRMADLMILNVIFILCCIPIVTIGASLTAISYVLLKIRDGEEGYIARGFFKSFKQNFRQATLIWLMILGAGILLGLDIYILRSMSGTLAQINTVLIMVLIVLLVFILFYVFAVLARFENTVLNTIKNACLMSILDFPKTLLMVGTVAAAIFLSFLNGTFLTWAILIWILIGFALIGYCNSWFLDGILKKYMPKEEEQTEEDVIRHMEEWTDEPETGEKEKIGENGKTEEDRKIEEKRKIEEDRKIEENG